MLYESCACPRGFLGALLPNSATFGPQHGPLSKPKLGQSAGKLASKLLDLGVDELLEPTSHAS